MSNTLLLHIGRPKTGSTALHTFLYDNAKKLEEYGWCYLNLAEDLPEIPGYRGGKIRNGDIFFQERNKLGVSVEDWDRIWNLVLKYLENRNVIISAEALSEWDTDKFLAGAKEKYKNIKVVIYLRRQDKFIESLWNSDIKFVDGCYKTFPEYIGSNEEEIGRLHYLSKLDEISRTIGKENLIVRVYEKQQLYGADHGIASDFLSILGIEPNWTDWIDCGIQNTRLNGNFLEIKRIFNSLQLVGDIDINQGGQYVAYFKQLSQVYGKGQADVGYFKQKERKEFLEQFASENEQIARKYLHREDGILFYDNKMDYPLDNECQCSSFEEDMIRFFSTMICHQNSEIQRLKRQNNMLACKVMLNNIKERKLLLFGAGRRCRALLDILRFPVAVIVDNDEAKTGETFWRGIKISNAKAINDWSEYFVIVTCAETDEMEGQLQALRLEKEKDYVLAKEYIAFG